jgi:hypothetical protein
MLSWQLLILIVFPDSLSKIPERETQARGEVGMVKN